GKDFLHFLSSILGYYPLSCSVVAVFSCVGDGISHLVESAFVDQVHDKLHLMDAFEVCHFRLVTGFYQRIESGLHQLCNTTAENCLLTKEVCFGLFLEGGLQDPGTARADPARVCESIILGLSGSILINGDKARYAFSFDILTPYSVARALRNDHDNVQVRRRL